MNIMVSIFTSVVQGLHQPSILVKIILKTSKLQIDFDNEMFLIKLAFIYTFDTQHEGVSKLKFLVKEK